MTTDEIEAERRRFEAYCRSRYGKNFVTPVDRFGDYESGVTYAMWTGWLAAIASERDRRKQEQDTRRTK